MGKAELKVRRRQIERIEARDNGPDWSAVAAAARAAASNTCLRCSYTAPRHRAMPVMSLIPCVLAHQFTRGRADGSEPWNLVVLCGFCRRRAPKRATEALSWDRISRRCWAAQMREFCGTNDRLIEGLHSAAKKYGVPVFWLE